MSKYTAMSDHELVVLYEKGIDEAFDVLLARNQEHLFAYILRLTQDTEQANDVFQETFMKAIVCIRSHQYRTTGKFSAWLLRIAHNLVVDSLRSNRNISQLD
jgi:RNA polymerase sigma-70 factor (ECF subfamily)